MEGGYFSIRLSFSSVPENEPAHNSAKAAEYNKRIVIHTSEMGSIYLKIMNGVFHDVKSSLGSHLFYPHDMIR